MRTMRLAVLLCTALTGCNSEQPAAKKPVNLAVTSILDERTFNDVIAFENTGGETYTDCTVQVGISGEPREQLISSSIFEWRKRIEFEAHHSITLPTSEFRQYGLRFRDCTHAPLGTKRCDMFQYGPGGVPGGDREVCQLSWHEAAARNLPLTDSPGWAISRRQASATANHQCGFLLTRFRAVAAARRMTTLLRWRDSPVRRADFPGSKEASG